MDIGRRIIYDSTTGQIVDILGEMSGSDVTTRPVWNGITYLDIPFGQDSDKYQRAIKMHVDIANKVVVFDQLADIPVDQEYIQKALYQSILTLNKNWIDISNQIASINKFISALKGI